MCDPTASPSELIHQHPLNPTAGVPSYFFYVHNRTNVRVGIKVEYKALHNNAWTTRHWHVNPGEKKLLFQTMNRYVYVTGGSLDVAYTINFKRHQADLGAVFNHHTHSLTGTATPISTGNPAIMVGAKKYYAIAIHNKTDIAINFKIKRTANSQYTSERVESGKVWWWWTDSSAAYEIRFDYDLSGTNRFKTYNLDTRTSTTRPTSYRDGRQYKFERRGNSLDLFSM